MWASKYSVRHNATNSVPLIDLILPLTLTRISLERILLVSLFQTQFVMSINSNFHNIMSVLVIISTMPVLTQGTLNPPAEFLDFNLKYMSYVGLWSNEKWPYTKKLCYKAYEGVLLTFAITYIVASAVGMYVNRDDFFRTLNNVDIAIISYNYFSKIVVFLIQRRHVKILVLDILHSGDKVTEKCKKLMARHVITVSLFVTAAATGFQTVSLAKGEMLADAWFPFNPSKNKWRVFIASQIVAVLLGLPILYRALSIQGLVCSIIMYLCEQLEDLQKRLMALDYSVENKEHFTEEFRAIIKKHIRLMGYAKTLKSSFKEYFLIQNLAVTVETCLNALMVSIVGTERKQQLASLLTCLSITEINAIIFCYLGQSLMDQSEGVARAAYESKWTSWPVGLQKDLLLVITAAQKNFSLSAGGLANMSMETFALALYNGYSIYAVLSDVVS